MIKTILREINQLLGHTRQAHMLAKCESPIERDFLAAMLRVLPARAIQPQHQIGRYRADFAIPAARLVIEVDGHDYHSMREQLAADAQRGRAITRRGWRVIRFTGSEGYADADYCAREVERIVRRGGR